MNSWYRRSRKDKGKNALSPSQVLKIPPIHFWWDPLSKSIETNFLENLTPVLKYIPLSHNFTSEICPFFNYLKWFCKNTVASIILNIRFPSVLSTLHWCRVCDCHRTVCTFSNCCSIWIGGRRSCWYKDNVWSLTWCRKRNRNYIRSSRDTDNRKKKCKKRSRENTHKRKEKKNKTIIIVNSFS